MTNNGADKLSDIAFIDLEASGLGAQSWPIEVGWRLHSGAHASYLIKPIAAWDVSAWDRQAEELHGISYEMLLEKGKAPETICAALNETLSGYVVYSDAPDWDGFWLYRLFQGAELRQAFELTDFREAFHGISEQSMQAFMNEAMKIAPHTHRAGDDVLHMKTLYDLAVRRR